MCRLNIRICNMYEQRSNGRIYTCLGTVSTDWTHVASPSDSRSEIHARGLDENNQPSPPFVPQTPALGEGKKQIVCRDITYVWTRGRYIHKYICMYVCCRLMYVGTTLHTLLHTVSAAEEKKKQKRRKRHMKTLRSASQHEGRFALRVIPSIDALRCAALRCVVRGKGPTVHVL